MELFPVEAFDLHQATNSRATHVRRRTALRRGQRSVPLMEVKFGAVS